MATGARQLVGVGLYSVGDAARILRLSRRRVRRWAGAEPGSQPLIVRSLDEVDGEFLLSFVNLIELQFISIFRGEGVSLQVIRAAAREAAALFGTEHPFALRKFRTDGRAIFAMLEQRGVSESDGGTGELIQELHLSQYVFAHLVTPFFRKLEWNAEELRRYWPLGKDHRVVIDPQMAFGQPVDAYTGVPTTILAAAATTGSMEEVARWYDVPLQAVTHAVEYEESLRRAS